MTNAPPHAGCAIEVIGVEKHYEGVSALAGVSFEVQCGEIFALLGPNGAGKTTTVEILEGYHRCDAGHVRVLGLDPIDDAAQLRPRIGVMLQEGGLYPGLKPREVLRHLAALYDDPQSPDDLIKRVGLDDALGTTVRRMSGGQKQRLSLAAALVGRPEVLFLDEPTAGMDPQARVNTWDFIRELNQTGVTVVLTTHLLDEVEALCDQVAILNHGTLAAHGSPQELMHRSDIHEVVFTTATALDLDDLARNLELARDLVTSPSECRYELRVPGAPPLIVSLASYLAARNIELGTLQANARSLEDVFLQITAEAEQLS